MWRREWMRLEGRCLDETFSLTDAAIAALVIAGCSHDMERVMLPPEAPMNNIRSIAVLGFVNIRGIPASSPSLRSRSPPPYDSPTVTK